MHIHSLVYLPTTAQAVLECKDFSFPSVVVAIVLFVIVVAIVLFVVSIALFVVVDAIALFGMLWLC